MNLNGLEIKKIGIFRALQLGDMLCSIPAARALRSAFPDASITLIGLPWAEHFVKRFSKYFDGFIHFPGAPGMPEQEYDIRETTFFLEHMHDEQFDLILQMQGNGTIVNNLVMRWGARLVAGFYPPSNPIASPYFMQYPEGIAEPLRHLALMAHLGIPSRGAELEFPIYKKDEDEVAELKLAYQSKYIIIHPGSRSEQRQWPIPYFAEIANYCSSHGYSIIISGTSSERNITRELIKRVHCPVIDLTGKTSLGAIAAIIKNASLLVSNCTGVSHIASATKTPSLIISMDGEPERWAPLDKALHHIIDWTTNPRFEIVMTEIIKMMEQIKKAA